MGFCGLLSVGEILLERYGTSWDYLPKDTRGVAPVQCVLQAINQMILSSSFHPVIYDKNSQESWVG
jgi:hypothetical protein